MSRHRKDDGCGLSGRTYRVIVKRQRVEVSEGQDVLFEEYRHQFIITNTRKSEMDAGEVVRIANGRCEQENTIEQLKNGIASLQMTTGELFKCRIPDVRPVGMVSAGMVVVVGITD